MEKTKCAYVTIATSKNYLVGLMAMAMSLKHTGTAIPLYAMLPEELTKKEEALCSCLVDNGIHIIGYNQSIRIPQQLKDSNNRNGDSRWNYTFDKLLVFELTQFEKIVYIDSDMYILHNIDHLFDMLHMSATVAGRSYPDNEDWVDLNSGIMVISPREGLVEQFEKVIPQVILEKGSCGDQDILQAFYEDWPKRPELDLGEKYNVFACYADYYENHLGYNYNNNLNDPLSIAVLHFIGEKKPWMQQPSWLSLLKQTVHLCLLKAIHKRNTTSVLLDYKILLHKAKKLLNR